MFVIPKIPRASGGALPPWAPYQGSTLDQLGTLSGPQIPRLLMPPLTTNPGSAPGVLLDHLTLGERGVYSPSFFPHKRKSYFLGGNENLPKGETVET